eukprot:381598-Prorocentrum_minimum.AAC.1
MIFYIHQLRLRDNGAGKPTRWVLCNGSRDTRVVSGGGCFATQAAQGASRPKQDGSSVDLSAVPNSRSGGSILNSFTTVRLYYFDNVVSTREALTHLNTGTSCFDLARVQGPYSDKAECLHSDKAECLLTAVAFVCRLSRISGCRLRRRDPP